MGAIVILLVFGIIVYHFLVAEEHIEFHDRKYDDQVKYPLGFQPSALKNGLSFEFWSEWEKEEYYKKDKVAKYIPREVTPGVKVKIKPTIVYYISLNDGQAYKIGLTTQTVERRFQRENVNIKTLKTWEFPTQKKASEYERSVLKEYNQHQYSGREILKYGGRTELFSMDILGLDS